MTQQKKQPGDKVVTYVAGVTYDNHQEIINELIIGDVVCLIPEPENPFDENAVKVVEYKSKKDIGYLPKALVLEIGKYFEEYTIPELPKKGKIIDITHRNTDHVGIEISFQIPSEVSWQSDIEFWSNSTQFRY